MKIKRFVAPDMRQAMREVREEQGADAVILSSRRCDEGIEIIAAVDYDEALVREAARHGAPLPGGGALTAAALQSAPMQVTPAPASSPPSPVAFAPAGQAVATSENQPALDAAVAVSAPPGRPLPPPLMPSATALGLAALQPMVEQSVLEHERMRVELGGLRELLEQQLSSLAWNDMERRRPMRARVLRDMTRLGIDADVARQLVDQLPEQISQDQARYLPLGVLSRSLAVSGRELAESAGVTALVGPTGVGKTTTIAKLAARAVLRHGAAQVALISTDHYRIGAAAQLEHYGRLLGVQVYAARDADELHRVLASLRGRHTVLVDTAGMAGGDPRLQQQMEVLRETGLRDEHGLRACLVLAANAQAQALEQSVRAYLPLRPQACIMTKLDEAPSLGGVLSVLIRHKLPLDYTTDGQRVPEDICAANAQSLVCRAAQTQRGASIAGDEVEMAERFGLAVAGL